jgi:3-phosphoshikimate 1-carboxyvinyltransferase
MSSFLELIPKNKAIIGETALPGSKSFTNRALILAAQCQGSSFLKGASTSDDSEALVLALQKLGVEVVKDEEGWEIHPPSNGKFIPYRGSIDVGPAGTTMRFLTALLASIPGAEVCLQGSPRMHERPIAPLIDALRHLGAKIEYLGKKGCPPLQIRGADLRCRGPLLVDASTSSQFVSALLLISPRIEHFDIHITDDATSLSYIQMTIASLAQFGIVPVIENNQRFLLQEQPSMPGNHVAIEGDASGASYLFALAALSQGDIKVFNISPLSSQGDAQFPSVLERMGCTTESGEENGTPWIRVRCDRELDAVSYDMSLMPDTAQTLALLCANANGKSILSGLHTLRIKETDRIAALQAELCKVACSSEADEASLTIFGKGPLPIPSQPIFVKTYDDHRMAMSFATLAAFLPKICIEAPSVVTKSFPGFWRTLESFGIHGKLQLSPGRSHG